MFIYCINYTIFTSKKIAYFSKNKKALITQNLGSILKLEGKYILLQFSYI